MESREFQRNQLQFSYFSKYGPFTAKLFQAQQRKRKR